VDWFPSIEASGLDLIETYVAAGLGIGLSVASPQHKFNPQLRLMALPDFPMIAVGALWRGKTTRWCKPAWTASKPAPAASRPEATRVLISAK